MKSSIKIIKRTHNGTQEDEESNELKTGKTAERKTRDLVRTIKSWIDEVQQRKRTQGHSFSPLPVIATVPANQNTD